MTEKNKKDHHLSIKDIISESILRDLILFTFLFLLILSQSWENILLLLLPLVTYTFSLFFRILGANKRKSLFKESLVIYNPLGFERINANRLFFSSMFQLILIFWLGAESLYNAVIMNSYLLFFKSFLVFSYTFTFFWIFIDIWKYTKIIVLTDTNKAEIESYNEKELKNVIAFLQLKYFKLTSLINFFVFIILNILNLIFDVLLNNSLNYEILLYLPGSQLITFSYLFYVILFIPPLLSLTLFILNYKSINNFDKEKLHKMIEPLPKNLQIKIIENLKRLNNKIKEQLKTE